jgi:hypothetical protein
MVSKPTIHAEVELMSVAILQIALGALPVVLLAAAVAIRPFPAGS